MLTAATRRNLERKAFYVDHVQMHGGKPLFSWIDLSLTELCNRACVFCPRVDPAAYPNQPLHMSLGLVRKIASELEAIEYEGAVVLCGFGEPLLHPRLAELVACFRHVRVEVVTNGDRLTEANIRELVAAGVDYFVVSLYDGEHQIEHFQALFRTAGCSPDQFTLRDRWYGPEKDYGLKLTNRAGTVSVGNQEPVDPARPCFYLAYQLTVDWNGDVLLCVQDWHKKVRFGNLASERLIDIWHSSAMRKRRAQLLRGDRSSAPCATCNATGTLHGGNHAAAWMG
jgi:radical SAM protein with 4Fe4S-binding SPASM domain